MYRLFVRLFDSIDDVVNRVGTGVRDGLSTAWEGWLGDLVTWLLPGNLPHFQAGQHRQPHL